MRKAFALLLCLLLLIGCASAEQGRYQGRSYSFSVPEPFEHVEQAGIVCFAPYGDPLRSSSITIYTTELNWYFDTFTQSEYSEALSSLTGYESITVHEITDCSVGGYAAKRVACSVRIDQGEHELILYVVNADKTYVFTLLNRDGDGYVEPFDGMIKTVSFTGEP